jgi:hypothetical protein
VCCIFSFKYKNAVFIVLGYLCQIGKLAPCLGVRSTSETWKLFANLTTRYTTDLQGHLLLEEPLSILTAEVLRILQSVSEEVKSLQICF